MATLTPGTLISQRVDNTHDDPTQRAPLVLGGKDFKGVTDAVAINAEKKANLIWLFCFLTAAGFAGLFFGLIGYLFATGVGVWGNNQPIAWGFPIINFVFWVGIGHAGTLISAVLFLFRQNWRTSINRFAEAMTIFAVICAGIFPGIHVGRPWLAYWLFPYPNQMAMWPQFRSPLLWDVFAVSTYASVSLLFWYTGMVPDLATLRDRAKGKISQIAYGIASLGWNGSSRHWHRFERAYILLAALCTPLVLSVHSVVSFDFAVAQIPGWHTTVFPPYFVAGAIYGGFAMVLTLAVPCRVWFGLKDIITERHIDNCCKVMLGVGMICTYAYVLEFFVAWYSGHHYEQFIFANRAGGSSAPGFWALIILNCVIPQILWFRQARRHWFTIMLAAMAVNIGMWFERYVIVISSLSRDFVPGSWADFKPTWVDIWMFVGSFGLFFTNFLLFLKFLPIVAMAEVKTVMPEAHAHPAHDDDHDHDHDHADESHTNGEAH
ncbi:MAG: NrfD/PsrC family molybdoenzyme membrane anchor subunit [Planctomycetota bacterium]